MNERQQTRKEQPDLIESLLRPQDKDRSARMIIKEHISAKNDVDLKTHFSERETLTFPKSEFFADEFEFEGFDEVAKLIRGFNDQIARKRFSFNRMSRAEFNEGLKPELAQEQAMDRASMERLIR